jgi:hypothetical protein
MKLFVHERRNLSKIERVRITLSSPKRKGGSLVRLEIFYITSRAFHLKPFA